MENLNSQLEASVTQMLADLSPISPGYCIYRAPQSVRELNEKAYTPQKVSIGPLHHGIKHLLPMEEKKLRYLSTFLDRTQLSLKDCISFIRQQEQRVRDCYVESIKLESNEFVKMILLDSCFVIEVIWRYNSSMWHTQTDYLSNPVSLVDVVRRDMILLENQIPFFAIAGLFDLALPHLPAEIQHYSLAQLSLYYFGNISLLDIDGSPQEKYSNLEAKHFVDLVRLCHLPSNRRQIPPKIAKLMTLPTARELREVGVSIRKGSSKNVLDIQYANGVLRIPQFDIQDDSEIVFRNLIAFELCHCPTDSYIIDYVVFMDNLLDTAQDVDILIRNGILVNWLVDRASVANLFHGLKFQVFWFGDRYYYNDICEQVNEYCKVPWHNWKATMKRDYCSTPWRIISIIAAVVLLMLTLIQAVCSILQI